MSLGARIKQQRVPSQKTQFVLHVPRVSLERRMRALRALALKIECAPLAQLASLVARTNHQHAT